MSRVVELGRAVLASSTQNLELWLTTLITISPSQHSINLQQLSAGSILQLLSSGDVWIGRGHGMCIELDLSLRGDQLPHQQFHDLINSILEAPVWSQLKLQPTLPSESAEGSSPTTGRFNITHACNEARDDTKTRHRLFSNVPAADVQPPEGVPKFALGTIRLCMDILETKQRPQLKRSRTSPDDLHTCVPQDDFDQSEELHPLLHDISSTPIPTAQSHLASPQFTPPSTTRKRKRPVTHAATRANSLPVPSFGQERASRRNPVIGQDPAAMSLTDLPAPETTEIQLLIDGAMRLSVCTNLNKTSNGLKVKANTFAFGLADVAPVLWRPGYLLILSQRAHLIPSISRAIGQAAGTRATSISLCDKLAMLQALPTNHHVQLDHVQDLSAPSASSSLACRLWLQMQKSLSIRSTPPLQPFLSFHAEATAGSDSELMFEEAPAPSKVGGQDVDTTATRIPEATRDCQTTMETDPYESPRGDDYSAQFIGQQQRRDLKLISQPSLGETVSHSSITVDADQKYLQLSTPYTNDDEILLEHDETHRVQQRGQKAFDDDLLLDYDHHHHQPAIHIEDDPRLNATQPGHGALPTDRDAEISLGRDLLFEGREDGSEHVDNPLPI